jgi:AraC-like DNA-binding protein
MNTTVHIDFLSTFMFLGVFMGLLLSFFFILKSRSNIEANLFQGLLLLSLALGLLEQLLNLTGYITRVLAISNYSEPLNFAYGPLLYLYVKRSLEPSGSKKDRLHFIPFILFLGYLVSFYVIQSDEYKYNSYLDSYHPDWTYLNVQSNISEDPLGIRSNINILTVTSVVLYIIFAIAKLLKKASQSGKSIFKTDDVILKSLRNMVFHFIIIAVIFLTVKISFKADLGDYFIGIYMSFVILLTSFRVMNDSTYFEHTSSFMDVSIGKYLKSSLNEDSKQKILDRIILELKTNHYFSNNLASLSELSKKIGESPHHVSQVINEKLNKSFFELLASYRIEEAKRIISDDRETKMTVEEISEMVGYNSKTAFNNAFKRLTGNTPSEFRRSLTS